MDICLNGETRALEPGITVALLVASLGLQGRFAVEVNGAIVPRSRFNEYHLQSGDSVEIVRAIGGG
jgi:thiamine biosynthesis protein ThiS